MIVTEFYKTREDGVNLYRTYSDADFMIRQVSTGAIYTEAVDIENSGNIYEETDLPLEDEDVPDEEALKILLGGEEDETA